MDWVDWESVSTQNSLLISSILTCQIVLENGTENKKRERSNSVEAADSKRTRHD
jgi:hypothetical protein